MRTSGHARIAVGLSLSVLLHVLLLWPQHAAQQPAMLEFASQPASVSVSFESTKLAAAPPRQQQKTKQTTATKEETRMRQATNNSKPPLIKTTSPAPQQTLTYRIPHKKKVRLSPPQTVSETVTEIRSEPALNRARIIARINQDYQQYFYYPKLARRRNIQGTVVLALGISAQGTINTVQLSKSSGYSMLDDAAENAMQRLQHHNQRPDRQTNSVTKLNFDVHYQLKER